MNWEKSLHKSLSILNRIGLYQFNLVIYEHVWVREAGNFSDSNHINKSIGIAEPAERTCLSLLPQTTRFAL